MNLKGGINYIDFKNNNLTTMGTFTMKNIFITVEKAFKSKKITILHNVLAGSGLIPDIVISPIRKRDNTHYTFAFSLTHPNTNALTLRYVTIDSNDLVTIEVATIQ